MNVMPPGIELGSSRTEGPTLTKSAIIALNLSFSVVRKEGHKERHIT